MKVAVWDTYVTRKDGAIMHFDILVNESELEEAKIFEFGKIYLQSKGEDGQTLSSKECRFCHVEKASAIIEQAIMANGFAIVEMENCK